MWFLLFSSAVVYFLILSIAGYLDLVIKYEHLNIPKMPNVGSISISTLHPHLNFLCEEVSSTPVVIKFVY